MDSRNPHSGNNLNRYMPEADGAIHKIALKRMVSSGSGKLSDRLIGAMSKDPKRFDQDMAALRDLLQEARVAGDKPRIKSYEDIMRKVLTRNMPGSLVVGSEQRRSMQNVVLRPPVANRTVTGQSADDRLLARITTLSKDTRNKSAVNRREAVRAMALDFGATRGGYSEEAKKSKALIEELGVFKKIRTYADRYSDDAYEDAINVSGRAPTWAPNREVDEALLLLDDLTKR